jgi:uncharacterized membrane protein HdeD (DUF308 family)
MREESDLSLEVVILLILGLFMSFFGLLLLRIQTGELPYNADGMYGLFLVLVSIQTITMGKTPFGDLRRSWMVILFGICTAVIGMTACFIPGALTEPVRILVGLLLAVGGTSLLFQLFVSKEKARSWMKGPGILRHLTLATGLVYVLSMISGLVTLLPGITTNSWTAVLLTLPGLLLFPVNMSLLPFSPDGQLGILMVIMAIQMMTMGDTPAGPHKRSRLMMLTGTAFAVLGIFSCIIPGILTGMIRMLLGLLNICGGVVLLVGRFLPLRQKRRALEAAAGAVPPVLKKLRMTQTVLNMVGIVFGLSMHAPAKYRSGPRHCGNPGLQWAPPLRTGLYPSQNR